MKTPITAGRLRELLHYEPETGVFTRRVRTAHCIRVGDIAGSVSIIDGYRRICLEGRMYTAHRLAWLYMTGKWPGRDSDHANLDRADNRWTNLREATRPENIANSRRRSSNSGLKGACWQRFRGGGGKWKAEIRLGGKKYHLGLFGTREQAHEAYCRAAKGYYGRFFRGDAEITSVEAS